MYQQSQTIHIDARIWFDNQLQIKILQFLSVFFPQPVFLSQIANHLNIISPADLDKLNKNLQYLLGHQLINYYGQGQRSFTIYQQHHLEPIYTEIRIEDLYGITSIGIDNAVNEADVLYTSVTRIATV